MPEIVNFDANWKMVITTYFDEFVAFFLPDLFKDIDWTFEPIFLDKELHEIVVDKFSGEKKCDNLVKVKLKTGEEKHLLIHIEAQGYHDKIFDLRMFTMNYRIWDQLGLDIVAIAIFTTNFKMPEKYVRETYGTKLLYEYNYYYVKDQKESELLASKNVFALVVLASYYAQKTKNKNDLRLNFKIKLIRLLFKRGYEKKNIKNLFIFIQNVMKLPEFLERKFETNVKNTIKMEEVNLVTKADLSLAKVIFETMHGIDVDEIIKKAEKAEKAEKEIQKNQKQKEQSILNLYNKIGLNAKQIANTLNEDLSFVKKVLSR